MKDKLQQLLGLGVILLVGVGGWRIWSHHDQTTTPATTLSAIALPDLGVVVYEPLEPIKPNVPPTPEKRVACIHDAKVQDAALRAILNSRIENDPLFGYTELTMQLAECAAKRWREAGW